MKDDFPSGVSEPPAPPDPPVHPHHRASTGDPRRESTNHSSGVRWVRAADLLAKVAGHAAGPGIDLHAELARRARRFPAAVPPAIVQGARSIGERRLPSSPRRGDLPARGI